MAKTRLHRLTVLTLVVGSTLAVASRGPAPAGEAPGVSARLAIQEPPQPRQPTEIGIRIEGDIGAPPRLAVPPFRPLSTDAETVAVAKTVGDVLWADLDFEREFYMIPRDVVATVPVPVALDDVQYDRWREIGANGVVIGTVQGSERGLTVQARVYSVRARQAAFSREYTGSAANPRLYAHTISDEMHEDLRSLRGVARAKLAFSSDRDGERIPGPLEQRTIKEIYISDYDGANQRRITVTRNLNNFPVWSPDGRAVAYTSWRLNNEMQIFVSHIYEGRLEIPTRGQGQNWLAAWSPDGERLAYTSNRDGNPEIYVTNADGTSARRLTYHPATDTTPTWSPSGAQIAFVSDRTGSPQVYVIGADGAGLRRITYESYCDRPTWSPAPYNEIAYSSRTGGGYDVKVYDLATQQVRQITFGEGSNESPAFSPTGRHLAFVTSRWGRPQIAIVGRDGDVSRLRRITSVGGNYAPGWSR